MYCSSAFLCSWWGNVRLASCHFVFYIRRNWHWSFFGRWTLPCGFPLFVSAIFLSKPLWFCHFLVLGIVSGFLFEKDFRSFFRSVDCSNDFATWLKGRWECFQRVPSFALWSPHLSLEVKVAWREFLGSEDFSYQGSLLPSKGRFVCLISLGWT